MINECETDFTCSFYLLKIHFKILLLQQRVDHTHQEFKYPIFQHGAPTQGFTVGQNVWLNFMSGWDELRINNAEQSWVGMCVETARRNNKHVLCDNRVFQGFRNDLFQTPKQGQKKGTVLTGPVSCSAAYGPGSIIISLLIRGNKPY